MSARQISVAYATRRDRTVAWTLLMYLAVGLLALLPRVLDLGQFLTGDEANFWLRRSQIFLGALRSGDFAATALTEHPGVSTMWLGVLGIGLNGWLIDGGWLPGSFTNYLVLMRLPIVLVHTGGVLLGFALLRRLLPPSAALLAALLWAADPFVIAYSRVLHVDALVGTFGTLSLLAACCYWHHARQRSMLALSAVCAGLAILSKSPALALGPLVVLIALLAPRRPEEGRAPWLRPLLAWGVLLILTVVVLWPALWVDPLGVLLRLRNGVTVEGGEPHDLGNFFLGRSDDAPGLLFYPVALALRSTPLSLLGLLLLPLVWQRTPRLTRRDLAALAGFALLFMLALSLFPKKFNRYLEPAFPALDILAAVGLLALADLRVAWRRRLARVLPLVVGLLAALNAALWHPYPIGAFNQALGGAQAGANTFLAGWGEGYDQVADWLNAQPDITGVVTASAMVTSLQPYMRSGAQVTQPKDSQLPDATGYVVVYLRQVQRNQLTAPFNQFYPAVPPIHTVRLHGVEYAWIYQAPPPLDHPRPASFGDVIELRGFSQDGAAQPGGQLTLRLAWHIRQPPPLDYTLFAHLIGADGQRHAQVDLPYPTSHWGARPFQSSDLPLALPAGLPAGRYRLVIGMYDAASGARLPLRQAAPFDAAIAGPDALLLTELVVGG